MTGELPFSAAAERNKQPILDVLAALLPPEGSVLEIASGTGQHICHFARALPGIRWQPTEPDEASREALIQRVREAGLSNVADPVSLDVTQPGWPVSGRYDLVLCINMVHISPWAATVALMRGASRRLKPGGNLVLYGPYLEGGTAAASNLEFDASLKRRNPEWGLRDLAVVCREAMPHNLVWQQTVRMPANNLSLVFRRSPA